MGSHPCAARNIPEATQTVVRTIQVIKKLSEVNYRIQNLKNRRNRIVVHFDRLKRFTAQLNLEEVSTAGPGQTDESSNQLQSSTNVGDNLELCEADDDEPSPTNNVIYLETKYIY